MTISPTIYPIEDAKDAYSRILVKATPSHIAEATMWYPKANDVARKLCDLNTTLDIERASCVIAAFSPRVTWKHNVLLATMFASGMRVRCLGSSIRNAEVSSRIGFDGLKGMKTNAFARNIAGETHPVTIDAWMIKPFGLKSVNKTQYNLLSGAVRSLALDYRMPASTMQALIWIVNRGAAE